MSTSRYAKIVLASSLFFGFAASSTAGCDGQTCEEGGGVVVDGKCEGKCDPSKCLADNTCVGNRCVLLCTSQQDCVAGQECAATKADAGTDVNVCLYTQKAENIGLPCPTGSECDAFSACPDGSPCGPDVASPKCDAAQCRPLTCLTAGVGDANAYCTTQDCSADTDCVGGMYCTVHRLPQKICGTQKGTDDPCVDPVNFTKDGAKYSEGPISLLRSVCKKRESCSPCASDLDCSLIDGQACVDINGTLSCAAACSMPTDCEDDHACVGGYCIPKESTCKGTGTFCEICNNDLDCAAGGATMACIGLTGDQKACFDTTYPDQCPTGSDNECPVSPSGKHGECIDEGEGAAPGDTIYHRCYVPFAPATNKFKCW